MSRFSLKSFFGRPADPPPPLRFNSWEAGGRGAGLFEKSAEALELERMNPLRGVDEWRLGQIFDDARDGIFADLAWLYNEIEGVEPALMACCETRESAAGEMGWVVRTADAERVLRPFRIARGCGCKFYLASDAHHPQNLDGAIARFARAVDLLDLTEKDKFRL